jgi:hypothetical protein
MADLYSRLKVVGFPRKYVQETILPDWWEDHLAQDPSNRRLAELAVAKGLGIPLDALTDPRRELALQGFEETRFRHWDGADEAALVPAVAIGRRAAEIALCGFQNLPDYSLKGVRPDVLRDEILAADQFIDLSNLLATCWKRGVPVLFIRSLPPQAKRVEGMALRVRDRPVILLSSSRKAPAWLIWHLAHEMGHIAHGHLGGSDMIDVKIRDGLKEPQEVEANDFAHQLVYGSGRGFRAPRHLKPKVVARQAQLEGEQSRILPASILASYAFHMNAWGVVQKALQILGQADCGPEEVRDFLAHRIDLDVLGESDRGFLEAVIGI